MAEHIEAHISQKPLLATSCSSVSASTSPSRSSSNIKIEQVLNSSSSAPADPFLQLSTAASPLHPSLPPPTPTSLLPLTTTLHISDSSAESAQSPEYRHHSTHPLPSSASPEQSMAAVVVPQSTHVMPTFTRPIRFVANDGLPPAKRRRISAACQTCRKRKTRCTGEKPICDTCRQNGHSCLGYSDPAPSTLSQIPQQQQQQRQENNRQVSSKSTPTPVVTTPTEKLTLKEPLFATRTSPQDRGSPQERASPTSQQCELPSHRRGPLDTSTPTRTKSQKRKPVDYHGKGGKGNDWGIENSRVGGRSGGGLTVEGPSPVLRYQTPPATQRLAHRIPYFRYFGPTAIVPGYKQMVVEVKGLSNRPRLMSHSMSINSPDTSPTSTFTVGNSTPAPAITSGTLGEIPFYDPSDSAPNNPLIIHLIEIFFDHLGCNFPFLRWETFIRKVTEKQVDVILVDAVCAVAARFSDHPLLKMTSAQAGGLKAPQYSQMCEYGTAFANRAKSQVVDTFACPNLATVQACILLAYVEFGSNRDSGLWMFLGIAIRMAQDLGLHKSEEMRGDAKGWKEGVRVRSQSTSSEDRGGYGDKMGHEVQKQEEEEGEEKDIEAEIEERERADTFWAVFFLDRVISSGTGRPVTIRTKEVGIELPREETNSAYPPPFPALVKIVDLYGRITDLLNGINDENTITNDAFSVTFSRLSEMETELTDIYQRLSPDLHFSVPNFRQYSSTNQGSVFLLLHIWFHTLIVLLHRPTLLIAFEGRVQQLFPNSHELSMSSAKTISDILSFAELIDPRAVNGNPFTSQPIYIAACAFLQEGLTQSSSNPTSRSSSPFSGVSQASSALTFCNIESISPRSTSKLPTTDLGSPNSSSGATGIGYRGDIVSPDSKHKSNMDDYSKTQMKHGLLAQAAHGNYQKCYKALKGLEVYWEGVRYILTVLDQKAKGIVDPLLYTVEEMESAEVHWAPNILGQFRGRAQRDIGDKGPPVKSEDIIQSTFPPPNSMFGNNCIPEPVTSPLGSSTHSDPHQAAIGLSATGTTNSPNLNITWFFSNNEHSQVQQNQFTAATPHHGALALHDPRSGMQPHPHNSYEQHGVSTPTTSPASKYSLEGSTPASDAEMLLGLSGAGQKPSFEQQHHEHHGHENHGHSMDGIVMSSGYSDGGFQPGSSLGGFGYGIMSESVNMNNLSYLHCLEYIPPYWDSSFAAPDEVG